MNAPRKHAELIKAWADGAEIQARMQTGEWFDCPVPSWIPNDEYRIKPEPRPDIVLYCCVHRVDVLHNDQYCFITNARGHYKGDNLSLIFDGETGKLKAAEVI